MIDESMIAAASGVLKDYYGMIVPDEILKCVLEDAPRLVSETKVGGRFA